MNCKPNQLAWIKVPKDKAQRGVEQLHNRVVMTKGLVPLAAQPTWTVDPPQSIRLTGSVLSADGTQAGAGQLFEVTAIPDAWLVPLRGRPVPTIDGAIPVLEQTV